MINRDSPIMSAPRCTEKQASDYLANGKGWYTKEEIAEIIVPSYFTYGTIFGVDPCVAIAQLIHETGFLTSWWSNRPRRNPAGIGVTGQTSNKRPNPSDLVNWAYDDGSGIWRKGLSFSEWKSVAIPAHVARLLDYAVPRSEMRLTQLTFVEENTRTRPVPPSVRGKSPTLAGLEGTWAFPGKGYADRLAHHMNRMSRIS
jgi:hypothetical protein